jgi:hypothetical protein
MFSTLNLLISSPEMMRAAAGISVAFCNRLVAVVISIFINSCNEKAFKSVAVIESSLLACGKDREEQHRRATSVAIRTGAERRIGIIPEGVIVKGGSDESPEESSARILAV